MNDILTCNSVSFSYFTSKRELKLLEDVNLCIKKGDVVSISGKSGSGKSTLLHIISSLKKPTAGEVRISDKNVYAISSKEVAFIRSNKIGFVFQSFNLINELSAYENIILPLNIAKKPKEYFENIAELSERIGVSCILKSRIPQLSGGEKARIAILRALACKPDIVFLDEPTGALDSENAHIVEDLILELSSNLSTSFIYVTHDTEFAKRAAIRFEIKDRRLVRI